MYYKIWMDDLNSGFSGFYDNRIFLSLEDVELEIKKELSTKESLTFFRPHIIAGEQNDKTEN